MAPPPGFAGSHLALSKLGSAPRILGSHDATCAACCPRSALLAPAGRFAAAGQALAAAVAVNRCFAFVFEL